MVDATMKTKSLEKWGARHTSRRGASELLLITLGLARRRPAWDPGRVPQRTSPAAVLDLLSQVRSSSCPG